MRKTIAISIACFVMSASITPAQESTPSKLPLDMLTAGAEVLAQADPAALRSQGAAATLAGQVHQAMSALAWQPGETAPKDRVILLGLDRDGEFTTAIGYWEVHDEPPFDGGRWTTTVWWGALPTHWAEIPAPPKN